LERRKEEDTNVQFVSSANWAQKRARRSATGTVENIEEGNDLEEREIARFGRRNKRGNMTWRKECHWH
jgi:hypothetical protein